MGFDVLHKFILHTRQDKHSAALQTQWSSVIFISQMNSRCSEVINLVLLLVFLFPEGEVLLEEFDDALGIAEVVLLKLVNLVKGFLERLVSKLTCSLVVLHHLVVEDGEIESETELDWVARGKGNLVGLLVCLKRVCLHLLELFTLSILSDVTVVVTDHLDEESLGLLGARLDENLGVDHVNNALAVSDKLGLNALLVARECVGVLRILGVLLNGGNRAARGALRRNQVLESNGKQVAFVRGHISTLAVKHESEEVDHVFEAFGLLSHTCKEDVFFNRGGTHQLV